MVFNDIGLRGAASLINFVVVTAAASACNSSLYTTGRMLAELTSTSHRPGIRLVSKLSRNSVPALAVSISAGVIAIAAILNLIMPGGVFTVISSIATTSFLFIWATIIVTHLRLSLIHI